MRLGTFSASLVVIALLLGTSLVLPAADANPNNKRERRTLQAAELLAEFEQSGTMTFSVDGTRVVLALVEKHLLSEDAVAIERRDDHVKEVPVTKMRTFVGTIAGNEYSAASVTIAPEVGQIFASAYAPGTTELVLDVVPAPTGDGAHDLVWALLTPEANPQSRSIEPPHWTSSSQTQDPEIGAPMCSYNLAGYGAKITETDAIAAANPDKHWLVGDLVSFGVDNVLGLDGTSKFYWEMDAQNLNWDVVQVNYIVAAYTRYYNSLGPQGDTNWDIDWLSVAVSGSDGDMSGCDWLSWLEARWGTQSRTMVVAYLWDQTDVLGQAHRIFQAYPNPAYSYAIVDIGYWTENLGSHPKITTMNNNVVAHEMGHLFGAVHEHGLPPYGYVPFTTTPSCPEVQDLVSPPPPLACSIMTSGIGPTQELAVKFDDVNVQRMMARWACGPAALLLCPPQVLPEGGI